MDKLLNQLIMYVGEDYTEDQKPFLRTLIEDATEEVMNIMCPYGLTDEEQIERMKAKAIAKYGNKIRKIAEYHYDKQGKEGTLLWIENGVHTSYESAGTPSSYLRGIVPISVIC